DFAVALRTILRLAGATYRKDTNIYLLGPRVQQVEVAQPTAELTLPETAPANQAAEQAWEKIPGQYQNARILGAALGAIALATEGQVSPAGGGYGGYGGLGGAGLGGFGNGLGGGGLGAYGSIGGLNGLGGLGNGLGNLGNGLGGLGN